MFCTYNICIATSSQQQLDDVQVLLASDSRALFAVRALSQGSALSVMTLGGGGRQALDSDH